MTNSNNNGEHAPKSANETLPKNAKTCAETILVVEDEPDLLDLVAQVLEGRGYKVIGASSGKEALQLWTERRGSIDLLLTDMTMPDGMSGSQIAQRMRSESPNLRVIFTSGHTAGIPGTQLAHIEQSQFLAKPYRPTKLLEFVRECLDGPITFGPSKSAPGVENN